jgi:hypothetical protein
VGKRIEPAAVVLQFFQEATPDQVRLMFPIVKSVVERRGLSGKSKTKAAKGRDAAAAPAAAAAATT